MLVTLTPYSSETWHREEVTVPCPLGHTSQDSVPDSLPVVSGSLSDHFLLPWESHRFLHAFKPPSDLILPWNFLVWFSLVWRMFGNLCFIIILCIVFIDTKLYVIWWWDPYLGVCKLYLIILIVKEPPKYVYIMWIIYCNLKTSVAAILNV